MYWVRSSYKRRVLQLEYQAHEMKTLIQDFSENYLLRTVVYI